jgi:hypothetical protein
MILLRRYFKQWLNAFAARILQLVAARFWALGLILKAFKLWRHSLRSSKAVCGLPYSFAMRMRANFCLLTFGDRKTYRAEKVRFYFIRACVRISQNYCNHILFLVAWRTATRCLQRRREFVILRDTFKSWLNRVTRLKRGLRLLQVRLLDRIARRNIGLRLAHWKRLTFAKCKQSWLQPSRLIERYLLSSYTRIVD